MATTSPGATAPTSNPLNLHLDSKSYSNICKRLAASLEAGHGVKLTHTQTRTAMAQALGFDSPNHLDALLKENDTKAKQAAREPGSDGKGTAQKAARAAHGEPGDAAQAERLQRAAVIRERLGDIMALPAEDVAIALTSLAHALLAERFPPKLSKNDKLIIRDMFPDATEALITERSLSEEGLLYAVSLYIQTCRIALDYFPKSNCGVEMEHDAERSDVVSNVLSPQVEAAFSESVNMGLSPFGAATTTILTGAVLGAQHGVHWSAMMRPLLDAVTALHRTSQRPPKDDKEFEEDLIKRLRAQMGISRAEAKQYIAEAKRLHAEGKF